MLSASETDRTAVEARLRAEVEQLLEDNLQLKRHKLEEASTCDGVVKLIKRYDRDRHGCPVPLTVRGTQALVSFAPLAFKLFYAARQNAVLRRSPFPSP